MVRLHLSDAPSEQLDIIPYRVSLDPDESIRRVSTPSSSRRPTASPYTLLPNPSQTLEHRHFSNGTFALSASSAAPIDHQHGHLQAVSRPLPSCRLVRPMTPVEELESVLRNMEQRDPAPRLPAGKASRSAQDRFRSVGTPQGKRTKPCQASMQDQLAALSRAYSLPNMSAKVGSSRPSTSSCSSLGSCSSIATLPVVPDREASHSLVRTLSLPSYGQQSSQLMPRGVIGASSRPVSRTSLRLSRLSKENVSKESMRDAVKAAAAEAAALQEKDVPHRPALREDGSRLPPWIEFGGRELETMLSPFRDAVNYPTYQGSSCAVGLLDARFLIALAARGGVLPRRQELPDEAYVSVDQLRYMAPGGYQADCLRIICVSHLWLQFDTPDPHGEQLQLLAGVLRCFLGDAKRGGQAGTYGVFYDFGSRAHPCHLTPACHLARRHALLHHTQRNQHVAVGLHSHVHSLSVAGSVPGRA